MTVSGVAVEPLGTVNSCVVGDRSAVHGSCGEASKFIVTASSAMRSIDAGTRGQLELPQRVMAKVSFRFSQTPRGEPKDSIPSSGPPLVSTVPEYVRSETLDGAPAQAVSSTAEKIMPSVATPHRFILEACRTVERIAMSNTPA